MQWANFLMLIDAKDCKINLWVAPKNLTPIHSQSFASIIPLFTLILVTRKMFLWIFLIPFYLGADKQGDVYTILNNENNLSLFQTRGNYLFIVDEK